jgi:hypothetical protein
MVNSTESRESGTPSSYDVSGNLMLGKGLPGPSLEAVLAERDRLGKELTEARAEVMRLRCQAEMLRQEWFTAKLQEEEYRKYIRKLTGEDPYVNPQEILEAEKNGLTMAQILAEMENETASNSGEG